MDAAMREGDEGVVRVARRVYVGNLAWTTSWQDLKDFFSKVGTVKYADVLREGGPGSRSKGCGIVEFETPEQAAAAIQHLNHADLDGRQIFVREDREDFELRGEGGPPPDARGMQKRPRGMSGGGGGGGSGSALSIGRRVYVGNLSYETTWQELKDHFKPAGHVVRADVLGDGEGRSKGCGVVEFGSAGEALRAISLLSNSLLNGRQIMVREDREDPDVGGGRRGVGGPGAGAGPGPAFAGLMTGSLRGGSGGGGGGAEGTQVVVHGIPYRMAWQDLKDLCRQAGPVVRADVLTNPDGSSKGYGLVQFALPQDAAAAIQLLNGRVVEGRVLTVRHDRFAGGGGGGGGGGGP